MQTARRIHQNHPALAIEIRNLCTALTQKLAKLKLYPLDPTNLSLQKIQSIAEETIKTTNIMLDAAPQKNKIDQWTRYRNMLATELPKANILYQPAKIPDALFRIVMCISIDFMLRYLAEKSPSIHFANASYTAFMSALWEKIPQYSITFVSSAYLASQLLFKKAPLKASTEKIVGIL